MSKPRSKLIDYSRTFRQVRGFTTELHFGKQAKHIPGRPEFTPGNSIVELEIREVQRVVEHLAGTGEWIGENRERIIVGYRIGLYFEQATKAGTPTNTFIIHYSKTGAHIVPAAPRRYT